MSRIRSIHPGIWTDEAFVTMSPLARLFMLGIWNECDDQGIFPWSPLQLKMRLLPMEGAQPDKLLMELVEAGFVLSFMVEGKQYGAVKNFKKYQHPKKPRDIYPTTEDVLGFVSDGDTVPNEFPTSSPPVPTGEEGNGGEGNDLSPNGDCASGDAPEHPTVDEVRGMWNERLAPELAKPIIRKIDGARRQTCKARCAEYTLDEWRECITNIRGSPFLRGERGWQGFTFDWWIKKANFQKILEGNYNDQPA